MLPYDKILHAAAQLFMAKGFHAASIRGIAGIAGVNSSMISYYFKSKENVCIQLLNDTQAALEDNNVLSNSNAETDESVEHYLRNLIENISV